MSQSSLLLEPLAGGTDRAASGVNEITRGVLCQSIYFINGVVQVMKTVRLKFVAGLAA